MAVYRTQIGPPEDPYGGYRIQIGPPRTYMAAYRINTGVVFFHPLSFKPLTISSWSIVRLFIFISGRTALNSQCYLSNSLSSQSSSRTSWLFFFILTSGSAAHNHPLSSTPLTTSFCTRTPYKNALCVSIDPEPRPFWLNSWSIKRQLLMSALNKHWIDIRFEIFSWLSLILFLIDIH